MLSAKLPSFDHLAHNAVVLAQAALVLLASVLPSLGGPEILDRAMDLLFAGYLALVLTKCVLDRPTLRLLGALALIAAYGSAGLVESYLNQNLGGFMYEAKLFVTLVLYFCLLDRRPAVSERSVRILFGAFIVASLVFVILNPGKRLHLVNESNYLCMYVGIALFSYLSHRGREIGPRTLMGLGLFTLFLIVASQSRTGAAFLALAWLVYFRERFGLVMASLAAVAMVGVVVFAGAVAIAVDAPIVSRFAELKNPGKVDRLIYLVEAGKIVEQRPLGENLLRLSFAEPVSTRVADDMKWLTSKYRAATEKGQLYPHHFHLAYLRLIVGHGFVVFILYLVALPFVWRHNRYLALGLGICSLSMSVPYLSLFFGALQIAMAFPTARPIPRTTAIA